MFGFLKSRMKKKKKLGSGGSMSGPAKPGTGRPGRNKNRGPKNKSKPNKGGKSSKHISSSGSSHRRF